jgi:hypothetical protein
MMWRIQPMKQSRALSILAASCLLFLMIACGTNSPKETSGSSSSTPASKQTKAGGNAKSSAADTSRIDPCALVTKAEAAQALGEIKNEAETRTGLHNEKRCGYSNMNGGEVSFGVYGADLWESKRMAAEGLDTEDLVGLGEEAFSVKRGTTVQLYVRKEGVVLDVNSTAGKEAARRMAEKALDRIPG